MQFDCGVYDVVDVESVNVVDVIHSSLVLVFCRLGVHEGWNIKIGKGTDAIRNNTFRSRKGPKCLLSRFRSRKSSKRLLSGGGFEWSTCNRARLIAT